MNLYLKYRPRTIAELDLDHVRESLTKLIKTNNLAHAYLLTGPRGAGKTSTARIMARIVNCEKNREVESIKLGEPCNSCEACKSILDGSAFDVIEIDAASNRGIDDMRELKEKIRLAPTLLHTKVYIIDEVHMLTTEAFNALLKTLEEPPSHSLFILCTTELHKVPETIVSRCVQIQFTKATSEEMQRSFKRVIEGEGKQVESAALEYLSKAVDGSFRDGVKILDQVLSASDKVTQEEVEQVITGSRGYKIADLIQAILAKDSGLALAKLAEATSQGVDINYLLLGLMRGLRDKLLGNEVGVEIVKFIFTLDEVARRIGTSLDGELLLQVAIIEWCGENEGLASDKQKMQSSDHSPKVAQGSELQTKDGKEIWTQVLGSIGSNNLALDTILSKASPGMIHGNELTIYVQYDFHRAQLMTEKNLVKLEQIISKAVGREMKVKCEVSSQAAATMRPPTPEATDGQSDTIDEAMAIFTN